jgi:excisionase family DNA binding protein
MDGARKMNFLSLESRRKDKSSILTAREVGQYLKLSESTIYKLAAKGDIPGFKIGDSWRFDMEEIQSLIQGAKKENQKYKRKE